jgi:hypothetical protein
MPNNRPLHDKLANLAHQVDTPFIRDCLNSVVPGESEYGFAARDIGELTASLVLFSGQEPPSTPHALLETILDVATTRFVESRHLERFLTDEAAVTHAAIVARTCVLELSEG